MNSPVGGAPSHRNRDGGIALAAHFKAIAERDRGWEDCLLSRQQPKKDNSLEVIELGSGCGIAGLAFAKIFPNCNVMLTDLPEAMEILDHNISTAQPLASKSQVQRTELDWSRELPFTITKNNFDLIILSDCTYNIDCFPALIRTLAALVSITRQAIIIVSTKVRHSSEDAFFTLMPEAGLVSFRHITIELPDDVRRSNGQSLETAEIIYFCHEEERHRLLTS